MKKVCSHKAGSIRFRRWSRKGYAVFVSLRIVVTIGHVCRSIADAALSKNKSFSSGNREQRTSVDERMAEDAVDDGGGGIFASASQVWNAVLLLFLMQRVVSVSGKSVVCPERYIPLYNIGSGMGKARKRVSLIPLLMFFETQISADFRRYNYFLFAKICANLRFNLKTYKLK